MRVLLRLAVVFATLLEVAARAPNAAPRYWQGLTRTDVDAAYALLHDNHPGASLELDDAAFRARLSHAYAQAKARALKVTSYEGYVATLGGFATAMGDKHIWSRPLFATDSRVWAGLVIARRGQDWVVAADDNDSGASLKGARLVSCDGIAADELARRRIGEFHAVWSIEAQRVQRAPWLLLDDGNPFLDRPKRCTFADDAASREVELKWREIPRTELAERLAAVPTRGEAGFGVRRSANGWWISIESLSSRAERVIAEVREKKDQLRNAAFVVVDVRGNDGGNSAYGDDLARALLGDAYVQAAMSSSGDEEDCPKLWRASAGNIDHLAEIGRNVIAKAPEVVRKQFGTDFASLKAAAAHGHDFAGKPCKGNAAAVTRPASLPPWPLHGKVYLLTDNSCFSSCLLMTDEFRRLGAVHIGEPTDAATNYMEVREEVLPSGLSAFSTLQAVDTGSPPAIGPFVPAILYPGSIADTQALESWIAGLASAR